MDDMDKLIQEVFQDIRDGRPITGVDSSDVHYFDSLPNVNERADHHVQSSSRLPAFKSSTASSDAMFMPDRNEHFSRVTVGPGNLACRPDDLGRAPYYHLLPTATSPSGLSLINGSMPPPSITRRKRRMEDDYLYWNTPKYARVDIQNAVRRLPSSAYQNAGTSGFAGFYEDTEGNALRHNNHLTGTSGYEENFPAVGSVPVNEQSSAQGLWPMATSIMASQRRPTQTPSMAAEYSGQPFPFPIDTQPSDAMPKTSAQITSMPATAYGFNFSWPSIAQQSYTQDPSQALPWGSTQPAPPRSVRIHRDEMSFPAPGPSSFQGSLGSWPPSAVVDDAFPSISTPSMPSGYCQDSSFAAIVQQHPHRGQPKAQRSRRGKSRQRPNQAPRTSAADSQPPPSPVADSSFSIASQASSSSSSADTSDPAPQKKGKKKAQTPFLLAEDKCHLCKEGFKRGSELHHHWTTNKHRLREREAENPGVIVTVDDLTPNCLCPSCGKGYTTPYVVKRHLKKCAGQAGSSQGGSQDGEGGSSHPTAQRRLFGLRDA